MNKKIYILFLILFIFMMSSTQIYAVNVADELSEYIADVEENAIDNVSLDRLDDYKNKGVITNSEYNAILSSGSVMLKSPEEFGKAFNLFMVEIHNVVYYLTSFGMLLSFLVFIIIFMRMTYLPTHSIERRNVMIDIVTAGVSTALLGAISLIVKLYYGVFGGLIDNKVFIASVGWEATFRILMYEMRGFISGFFGLATLTMIAMFIRAAMLVMTSGDNPGKRAQAFSNMLFTIIGAAGLGGITFFVAFFTGLLN